MTSVFPLVTKTLRLVTESSTLDMKKPVLHMAKRNAVRMFSDISPFLPDDLRNLKAHDHENIHHPTNFRNIYSAFSSDRSLPSKFRTIRLELEQHGQRHYERPVCGERIEP